MAAMHSARTLFWDLILEEDLPDALGSQPGASRWYEIVPVKDGDVLVFESAGGTSQFRRFVAAKSSWNEAEELPLLSVNAAVQSPANPEKVCILHCPLLWGSDHRYEVYSMDAAPDSDPAPEPLFVSATNNDKARSKLVEAGIAPKKRHGFSLAPCGSSLFFLCGLQHFPGDTTGSFVYCFSLEERVWTEVEYEGTFPATNPGRPYSGCRFGQSCVVYNRHAWIFGGFVASEDGGVEPTNSLFSFDLEDHRWEEVTKMSPEKPPVMSGHHAVAFDDQTFIFGGDEGAQNAYCYNMVQSHWSQLPPLLLGPRPSDGRVVYGLETSGVVAYQQGPSHDGEPNFMDHGIFKVSREQLNRAMDGSSQFDRRVVTELDLFLLDEASADAEFMVEMDGTKVPVHRAVLKRFAPALARLFGDGVPTVKLPQVKTRTLQLLLQQIYSRFTADLPPQEAEALLKLAQRFELQPLLRLCQDSIVIDAHNVHDFLRFASQVNTPLDILSQKCIEYLTSHPEQLSLTRSPVRDRMPSMQIDMQPVESSQNLQQLQQQLHHLGPSATAALQAVAKSPGIAIGCAGGLGSAGTASLARFASLSLDLCKYLIRRCRCVALHRCHRPKTGAQRSLRSPHSQRSQRSRRSRRSRRSQLSSRKRSTSLVCHIQAKAMPWATPPTFFSD